MGLTGSKIEVGLSVFPNPSSGTFSLLADGLKEGVVQLCVRNAQGALVFSKPVDVKAGVVYQELDLSGLSPGWYFGELITSGRSIPFKLVRQ
jgi:hypothetical protein